MDAVLLTGIDEIDAQHKSLFDCLVALEGAVKAGNGWSMVHYALVELDKYVSVHFAVEEVLMRLHGYPGLDAHCAAHRNFSHQLLHFRQRSLKEDISHEIVEHLRNWLADHIGKTDQEYVPYLRTAAIKPAGGG